MIEKIKKLLLITLLLVITIGGVMIGKSYWKKLTIFSQNTNQQSPTVNITTPTPNVEIKNIIDSVSPWKKPPVYEAYTVEEVKNFKDEELILNSEINAWFQQAKKYPYKPFNAIFYGTPMTGKTSLARKLAKEANLPFVAVRGSDLKEQLYEQRTIKDKFKALLEDLKTNPKTAGKNYILFVDEADHTEDKLKFVKDMLAGVDDKAIPNNLWIFVTNYIDQIDKALYLNKERLKYKLDFSWNKKTFLNYITKNNVFPFLTTYYPSKIKIDKRGSVFASTLDENRKLCVEKEQNMVEALNRCGSKNNAIYNKFNFETLQVLKSKSSEFESYFQKIIGMNTDATGLFANSSFTIPYPINQRPIPIIDINEWKDAIHINSPSPVNKIESNGRIYLLAKDRKKVIPYDEFIGAAFEYCLEIFWKAYDEENNLDGQWGIVNPTNFLAWAKNKGYTFEDLGINVYTYRNNDGSMDYNAQIFQNKELTIEN